MYLDKKRQREKVCVRGREKEHETGGRVMSIVTFRVGPETGLGFCAIRDVFVQRFIISN